ncbi:MAG: response regulator [Acidobacteriota bacterium]
MALLDSLEATILIVGDEKPVCDLLTQILSDGYTCITASTVEEALMFMSNSFFDVVITDIGMPDDTGFALCDFIQRTHPEMVIIVISKGIDRDKIALHGAFDCIEEPFEPGHVQMAVGRALSYSRLRRNLICASRPD